MPVPTYQPLSTYLPTKALGISLPDLAFYDFSSAVMSEEAQNGARPTTQLDFNQAMKDFATMFPEMDRDVIEEVRIRCTEVPKS